ncbi:MAG: response regulator [Desulfobacteraceae bacterium]
MRILSVDDSKTVRQKIKNLAEVIGMEVLEAENGQEGLEVLETFKGEVDLILLDVEMPVMDGHEFLRTVKQDGRYQSIPVIMLTSVSQKEKVIEAVRGGAKQYITKPFSGEDVLAKIIQTLGTENLGDL